jgi:hypothetical protein
VFIVVPYCFYFTYINLLPCPETASRTEPKAAMHAPTAENVESSVQPKSLLARNVADDETVHMTMENHSVESGGWKTESLK